MSSCMRAASSPGERTRTAGRAPLRRPQLPRLPPRSFLFLLNTLTIGGSERKIVRLANALAGEGEHVVLAYLNDPDTLRSEVAPQVTVVGLQRTGKLSLRALLHLRQAIRAHRIEMVVAVNLYPALYAGLLARLPRSGRGREVRYAASLNTTTFDNPRAERRMRCYAPLLRRMDLLIFGAEYQRALWQHRYLGAGGPPAQVLYNGVDAAHFCKERVAAWRVPAWPPGRIAIGSVGRLRPEKSQDHLLHALKLLNARGVDAGAVIVGEGGQERALRELCGQLGLADRVHFAGEVQDVRPFLAGFDLLAITSTAVETFSNAALEALAMECPVVSSDIGGMPEMLADGAGLVYPRGDIAALTDALQLLATCPARRLELGQGARLAVLQRFSLAAMVASFRALTIGGPEVEVQLS